MYVQAGSLSIGDVVFTKNGESSVITKISSCPDIDIVYNIDVENVHNYIVENVRVHSKDAYKLWEKISH
jgi:hypothetical protein